MKLPPVRFRRFAGDSRGLLSPGPEQVVHREIELRQRFAGVLRDEVARW